MLVALLPALVRAVPASPQNVLKAVVNTAAPSTIAHETNPMSKAYSTPSWPASSRRNALSTFIQISPCYVSLRPFAPPLLSAFPPSGVKGLQATLKVAAPSSVPHDRNP